MSKIYVELRSGLGNQLFQFSFAYALAKEFDKELVLCPAYFDSSWKYWIKKLLSREVRSFRLPLIIESEFPIEMTHVVQKDLTTDIVVINEDKADLKYVRDIVSDGKDVYLKGYWQRRSYFSAYHSELLDIIHPTFKLSKTCSETLNRIDQSFVGIHVRRGDFLTNRSFGACRIDYYKEAIRMMVAVINMPTFIVFTNDKLWVKENFPKDISYIIYLNERNPKTDIEEFYLMTKFNSLIISNSTFSWWGGYLNTTERNKVICPSKWFLKEELQKNASNFICENWLTLDNQLELKS